MSINAKSLLYNFLCFAGLYISLYFLIIAFTNLTGFWIPAVSAVAASLLAPKFYVIRTDQGRKMFMKWLFIKGIKQIH